MSDGDFLDPTWVKFEDGTLMPYSEWTTHRARVDPLSKNFDVQLFLLKMEERAQHREDDDV